MAAPVCGIITTTVGAILLVVFAVVGYLVVPGIIENVIVNQVSLIEDTLQMERFEKIPFPLEFKVHVFNVSNSDAVLTGNIPIVREVGPYIYKLHRERVIDDMTEETISYRIVDIYEFDAEASYPYTEEDEVTIINVPFHSHTSYYEKKVTTKTILVCTVYRVVRFNEVWALDFNLNAIPHQSLQDHLSGNYLHSYQVFSENLNPPVLVTPVWYSQAILQMAEVIAPNLMGVLNLALNRVFGEYNSPYVQYQIKDLLWNGINICSNPGVVGAIPCNLIRETSDISNNLKVMEDGTVVFSLLSYKNETPTNLYEVYRGTEDVSNLGVILNYNNASRLNEWIDDDNVDEIPSVCNKLRGTDSAIFPPFVNTSEPLHAHNPDICRTVELRYERDEVYEEINVRRYSVGAWFLDNNEGCYCINQTNGITQPDGCLHNGAMELYTCVGAYMVLSFPHFLFSDYEYSNQVLGLTPNEEQHKIILDIEPTSGTVIRGAKRAQFNIFSRPINGITSTRQLLPTLMPIFWIEESVSMPDEYVKEVLERLQPLQLVEILRIVFIVLSILVIVIGAILIVMHCTKKPEGIVGLGANVQLDKTSE